MDKPVLKVGVVGYGYWGPKLVRNFTACPHTHVHMVADLNPERRALVEPLYPWVKTVAEAGAVFESPDIDAVAIATPLFTHFELAKAALEAGKHVVVEKPLASSVAECEELQAIANERGLIVMVDHTFVFTGAVRKVKEVIEAGTLGKVLYFDSVRINLGLFQPDFNVVWDLAPHDLSIIDYVLGGEPRWVSAVGAKHYDGQHENLAYLSIGYDDNLLAHVHCNWVAPVKTRRITIAGTKQMLVYDDTDPMERVKLYESAVDITHIDAETAYRMNVEYRTGDVLVPRLDNKEALARVVEDFAAACRSGEEPVTDAAAGIRVVRMLEAAQKSIENNGERVML